MQYGRSLQIKYNLLHGFYWTCVCTMNAFAAVFLGYKGLTDTQVGIATGLGAVAVLVTSPTVNAIYQKYEKITIRNIATILYIVLSVLYLAMAWGSFPPALMVVSYILLYGIHSVMAPFLTVIFGNYNMRGGNLNFGLARGHGSVTYAVGVMVLSRISDMFDPRIIPFGFIIPAVCLLVIFYILPDGADYKVQKEKEKKSSVFDVAGKYPVFMLFVLSFTFNYCGTTGLSTYLIRIVEDLHGSLTLYGVIAFLTAVSELPFMVLAGWLIRKLGEEKMLLIGMCLFIFRNGLVCIAPNFGVLTVGVMMQGATFGVFTPVMAVYISRKIRKEDQLTAQAIATTILPVGISASLANFGGGLLVDHVGLIGLKTGALSLTFIGVALAVSAYVLSRREKR